nr:uncharacterized protein LOC129281009 [Lytechinus pictus]
MTSPSHGKPTSNWPEKMDIKGLEMPKNVSSKLEGGVRLGHSERCSAVRVIVAKMQNYEKNPIRQQCDVVARRVVKQWPGSFCDMNDDDSKLGSGHFSLLTKIKWRVEHVNRNNTLNRHRASRKQKEATNKLLKTTDTYGCINWQPVLPAGESVESLMEKRETLKSIFSEKGPESPPAIVDSLMTITYYLQRKVINGPPQLVSQIKEQWPYLFVPNLFTKHFTTLTGVDIASTLLKAFQEKGQTILRFLVQEKWEDANHARPLVEAAAAKDDANLHDVASGVLRGLQSLFKEGNDSLFLIRDVTDTAEDMEKEGDASDSPKLIIQGDPFDSAKSQWMVMVESRVIGHSSSTTEGFLCGVAYLFATYYNLNLEYPSTAAATLEFIQRCLLGISPDGSKCHASKSHCNAKVVSFVRRFADFQWL